MARKSVDALFIGFEDQENLGLRSIVSYLRTQGCTSTLLPFKRGHIPAVVQDVRAYSPRLVGFSIIFQYSVGDFAELALALRQAGVRAHFTAGGHFPTLRPSEVMEEIPQLDSVVRFEGELTTADLLRHLANPEMWPSIPGIAFRRRGKVLVNTPRPLVPNLDALPPPHRDKPRSLSRGVRTASLLASRGCLYNCTYCSIRQFYGGAPGSLRRVRSPKAVIAEMLDLWKNNGVRFFIFQDDDFAAKSTKQRQWVEVFLEELERSDLTAHVRWKISCRADDVEKSLMAQCHSHGLIAVFLGIESGNPAGLRTCNKRITVEQNIAAIELLKSVGITFNMGFMLFDPDSTIDTVRQNLDFLRHVAGDGSCPVNFCKMLPYAGTPIEKRLALENRLKGSISQPDYDFLDPRLDWYALFAAMACRHRNFDPLGLVERLGVAKIDQILAQEFESAEWALEYSSKLRAITAKANNNVLEALDDALQFVEVREVKEILADWSLLGIISERLWQKDVDLQNELDQILAVYSPDLLKGFSEEFHRRVSDASGSSIIPS